MQRLLLSLAIVSAVGPASAQNADADQVQKHIDEDAKIVRERFDEDIKFVRERTDALPLIELERFADAVDLYLDGNELHIRSSLPTTTGARLKWPGKKGFARVTSVQYVKGEAPPAEPATFLFIQNEFGRPGMINCQTSVRATMNIEVVREWENLGQKWQIGLIQYPETTDEPAHVVMSVSGLSTTNEDVLETLRLVAPSIPDLRRQHATEVTRYLLPIFRDFGLEYLLAGASNDVAWLALGRPEDIDPKTLQQIETLVKQLDADGPLDRARAADALQKLGQPAVIVLARQPGDALSPEQRSQIDAILASGRSLGEAEIESLASNPQFLLDCMTLDEPILRQRAADRLAIVLMMKIDFDPVAAPEARAASIEKLRSSLSAPATQP